MANKKMTVAFGLEENVACALAYVGGWLSGLIFLLVEKDNGTVRFHAMQSILAFGGLMVLMFVPIVGWVLSPFLWIISFVVWLYSVYKAYQGEKFKLPIVGKIAQQQLKKIK
ncbi:MAG: hypothetical protein UX85_C0004G0067 [Candidatus Beckwithbacteria bacterium GW2011_GWB1_47_15]|uniref:Chloroplast import component protein (Tic20) n=1 Tax=Candidatus Beckwithbacteria bacterium GW2011_GWB1_47_15 TaxID=1618371 RepID=A0A0G1UTW3_9BACT|nr:MAG: hypothetical protein UY43_C0001G0175 [Candidatus Beckwithbacteria bacterium GW2011_GWC1_49_16]KKU35470.1 MAG: hypothetical protein UX50_C0003G0067 [Candidatus Beckwithbacteria bacterium GW2011_GWA1_46_30]KKU61145.1 MAG: hypothetical protein UX85_C0004G0067 [Candidatus Beckwithbacteria bacterium GW2011_GWB1_47_15]KKU71984.1 MAG: hypothetical protein UX97_C0002G0067 [Candidatus Beckwithbacteria bacterium GW2011_GWA2_47_25]KKW03221.1 MAG: hypothetical protein UY37_C0006G0046 [Candidatus Be